jgi:hypothetical protein
LTKIRKEGKILQSELVREFVKKYKDELGLSESRVKTKAREAIIDLVETGKIKRVNAGVRNEKMLMAA